MGAKVGICTPDNPYTEDRHESGMRWEHYDNSEVQGSQVDGYPGGDIVTMKCNVCGITWKRELAQ